jgi:hypothetical protein
MSATQTHNKTTETEAAMTTAQLNALKNMQSIEDTAKSHEEKIMDHILGMYDEINNDLREARALGLMGRVGRLHAKLAEIDQDYGARYAQACDALSA